MHPQTDAPLNYGLFDTVEAFGSEAGTDGLDGVDEQDRRRKLRQDNRATAIAVHTAPKGVDRETEGSLWQSAKSLLLKFNIKVSGRNGGLGGEIESVLENAEN